MSKLVYGGVSLDMIRTKGINQTPKMDDSGTDYLFTEVEIHVTGQINTAVPDCAVPGETSAAQVVERIRSTLMTPRLSLYFLENGDLMLASPPAGSTVDWNNGPKPMYLNVVAINGDQTIQVAYGIKTAIRECPSNSPGGSGDASNVVPPYISNRWAETISINDLFLSKRMRRGKLHLRANASQNPDDYRSLVLPPLLQGFRRTVSEYTLQEDGLALMYNFVDEESYNLPPFPALKFECDFSYSTNIGSLYEQQVSVRVWGMKKSPKASLITAAVNVALSRLDPINARSLIAGRIMDRMHENYVQIDLRLIFGANPNSYYGLNGAFGNSYLDFVIGSSPQGSPPDPSTHGTADYLKLYSQVLGDPCLGYTTVLQANPTNPPTNVYPTDSVLQAVPFLPNDFNPVYNSATMSTSLYTDYHAQSKYEYHSFTAQLPQQGPSPVSSFVQLANPTMRKVVEYTVEAIGEKPIVPSPNDFNAGNEMLLRADPELSAPVPMADGTVVWRVSGRYVYAIQDPTQAILNAPTLPYTTIGLTATGYDQNQFKTGMIAGLSTGGGGGYTSTLEAIPPGGQGNFPPPNQLP